MPDSPTLTGAPWTVEPGAIVFLPEVTEGFTEDEVYALFSSGGGLVAAAEVHDGAMIALVPSTEDVIELVQPDGEPIEQMHVTVFYLGTATDIDDDRRENIHAVIEDLTSRQPVVIGDLFGFSVWNPAGPEPCLVCDVNGDTLLDVYDSVEVGLDEIEFEYPAQHLPWRPHITLAYSTTEIPDDLLTKTGPVTFDRLRVAFGGVATDYPLGGKIT